MPGMARALLSARLTGGRTNLENAPQDLLVGARPPRRQGASGRADIRTVEIETDALPEVLDHLFGQAGIGTGGARLRAGVTIFDAAHQGLAHVALHVGVVAESGVPGLNLGQIRNDSRCLRFPRSAVPKRWEGLLEGHTAILLRPLTFQ